MKLIFCRINNRKKNIKSNRAIYFERVLYMSFIITFAVLIIAQAVLVNDDVRTTLSISNQYEGSPLGIEEFLYEEGNVVLQLVDEESNTNLKILVNGDEIQSFDTKNIEIKVKNGDVIEIDGSETEIECEVEIVSSSDNIILEYESRRIYIKSDVKRIAKVKTK